ncbi:MAG: 3-dehydroquinate synthase [Lentisphaeria bacterium]|nr:3-dehydroquinate synthase [Lentisphaeria bacterium]
MKTVGVDLGTRSYDIVIGAGALAELGRLSRKRTLTVMDSTVKALHGAKILASAGGSPEEVFSFPAGERSKTPETAVEICRCAARLKFDRSCRFAAAGGGVTGDLTGFAAAIFMRGIEFIQIPTTLLAAVDSGVGGKTGADIPEGKNLVGAFHQPAGVFIDTRLLTTLPASELGNGLAEIVKTAVILDPELFELLENSADRLVSRPDFEELYPEIIRRCCELKGMIVAEDEKESGRRAVLNYGHTFGHAVELLSDYTLPHGQAVAIGMAAASHLAVLRGLWKQSDADRQNRLLSRLGLPVKVPPRCRTCDLVNAMRADKKNVGGAIRVVLCSAVGSSRLPEAAGDGELAAAWEMIR